MSEKVLGFYEKDASIIEEEAKNWDEGCWETYKYYKISEHDFVSVRLASESVTLEELRNICDNIETDFDHDKHNRFSYSRTLEEVIERAKKRGEKVNGLDE